MQSLMPPIDSADNLFHNGNPLTGEKGTIVTADFLNNSQGAIRDIQSELMSILTEAGLSPDPEKHTQVLDAIRQSLMVRNSNFFLDSGGVNNIVISPTPALLALNDGQVFDIFCASINTGAVTLKVNNLQAFPVIGSAGPLQGGEIGIAKGFISVVWSSSKNSFLLVSQNTAGPLQVASPVKSSHAVNFGLFSNSLLSPGYQKLPGGLVIQWGYKKQTSQGGAPVSFPLTFSSVVLAISVTPLIKQPIGYDCNSIDSYDRTGMYINRMSGTSQNDSQGSWDFFWLVLGY